MVLKDLGNRIRARREKLGLKQQDMAKSLGIGPQAVSKRERGENAASTSRPGKKFLVTRWGPSLNPERLTHILQNPP
jgi:predicted transcriptional regulator